MKNVLAIALLFFTLGNVVNAQIDGSVDERLYARFSQEEIKNMQAESPELLDFWSYYLDSGFTVMEMPKGKGDDLPGVDFDPEKDNVLALKVEPQENGNVYLRINATGQLLALHSYSEVRSSMTKVTE